MNIDQRNDLLQQMLETEMRGVQVYETALTCVLNEDLKKEWGRCLEQTRMHVHAVTELMAQLGIAPAETPGRRVVRYIGESLVQAMTMAKTRGPSEAAELVACECVVHAETKDHSNWELLAIYAEAAHGAEKKAIQTALDEIQDQEDEHLYHSKGWWRELAIASLGMEAVLPPPEVQKDIKAAIGDTETEMLILPTATPRSDAT